MIKSKVNPNIFLFLFYFQYILQGLLSVTRIYLYVILFSFQTFSIIQKEPLNHFVFFLSIHGEVLPGEWSQSTDNFQNERHICIANICP